MLHSNTTLVSLTVLFLFAASPEQAETAATAQQDSAPKLQKVTLARGGVTLYLPADWKSQKLRSSILEKEFVIPAVKDDKTAGRLTMMRSGGSIKANVDRWISQFSGQGGAPVRSKIHDKTMNEQEVKIVDISGTFKERLGGGPFAPGRTVERPKYRMLAGIVQTKGHGQYFFKLVGPEKTMAGAEKPFMAMMESIKSN